MALRGVLVQSLEGLASYHRDWDSLAVALGRPYSAPAWMLAWWRHARPPGAELRVVAAVEGDELIGVAPFYVQQPLGRPARYRVLSASMCHRAEPLAVPGRQSEVASVVSQTLTGCVPRPATIQLDNVAAASGWPAAIADRWPSGRRPLNRLEWSGPAPGVTLHGLGFDDWLQGKSRNFRNQTRRLRRRLEARGGQFRIAGTLPDVDRDLVDLERLHHRRWTGRGGSVALDPSIGRMLREVGRDLLDGGRFRLVSVRVEGRAIAVLLFLAAGGEVSYWNGGFDDAWAAEQPSMRALVTAIEDGFARSDRRLDLGGGAEPYKARLADHEERLETTLLVPKDERYALTRVQLAPHELRRVASRHLPPTTRRRLSAARRVLARRDRSSRSAD
jgi:CelD/BcsL family acetyltransferase involved in cellulose biosynthesis